MKNSPRFQEALTRQGVEWPELVSEEDDVFRTKLLTDVFLERKRITVELEEAERQRRRFNAYIDRLNKEVGFSNVWREVLSQEDLLQQTTTPRRSPFGSARPARAITNRTITNRRNVLFALRVLVFSPHPTSPAESPHHSLTHFTDLPST